MPDANIVRLRPLVEQDLERLNSFDTDPSLSGPYEWTGFRNPQGHRRRWEEDGYLGEGFRLLAVGLADEQFAGFVSWWPVNSAGPPGGCFEIGILVFPDHRGRGLGTAAQRLLADYLFSTTLANRLQAHTDTDNIGEQLALERAGFQQEGTLRGAEFVAGCWRNLYLYSRLRSDPDPITQSH